jgi:predicted secreted protein
MLNMKGFVITVINWASEIATRRPKQDQETVPGNHSKDIVTKTAVLGTVHIKRDGLQCET